jgi:hypothetical protein
MAEKSTISKLWLAFWIGVATGLGKLAIDQLQKHIEIIPKWGIWALIHLAPPDTAIWPIRLYSGTAVGACVLLVCLIHYLRLLQRAKQAELALLEGRLPITQVSKSAGPPHFVRRPFSERQLSAGFNGHQPDRSPVFRGLPQPSSRGFFTFSSSCLALTMRQIYPPNSKPPSVPSAPSTP